MAAGNKEDNVLKGGKIELLNDVDDLNRRLLKCVAFEKEIERAMKNAALYGLKPKAKNSCRMRYVLINIPIIRHAAAIFEALIMLFWRNYFGDGTYTRPDDGEMDAVYDLWAGHYYGRNEKYSNKEIEKKTAEMAEHVKSMGGVYKQTPTEIPDAIYLKTISQEQAPEARVPFTDELKVRLMP